MRNLHSFMHTRLWAGFSARSRGDAPIHLPTPEGKRPMDRGDQTPSIKTFHLSDSARDRIQTSLLKAFPQFDGMSELSVNGSIDLDPGEILFIGGDGIWGEDLLTIRQIVQEIPTSPIFVVLPCDATETASRILAEGVEYLFEDELEPSTLVPAMEKAVRAKQIEDEVRKLAGSPLPPVNDHLTGLMTRNVAIEFLEGEIFKTRRRGGSLACLVIRLRDLEEIREVYGTACEHVLIKETSNRLKRRVRHGDVLARLEEGDFLVVLPDVPEGLARERATQIAKAFALEPYDLFGKEILLNVLVGVAMLNGKQTARPVDLIEGARASLTDIPVS